MACIDGWEQYPMCLSQLMHGDVNLATERQRIVQEGPRMFSGQGNIEAWSNNRENRVFTRGTFNAQEVKIAQNRVYFLCQVSSWSHLQTSAEEVQKLLTAYSVSPAFLNVLYSFGAKVTGDDDPFFDQCHHECYSSTDQEEDVYYETCYILRAFEQHNRPTLQDPWSLRQMAVYQKYHHKSKQSLWIFVQPLNHCKEAIWNELSQNMRPYNPTNLHTRLIGLTIQDWRWYLNSIRRRILEFNEKAMRSSLSPKTIDYCVDFDDCQRLQIVCNKLSLAQNILESTLEIAHMIQRHCKDTQSHNDSGDKEVYQPNRIPGYIRKVEGFLRTTAALEKQAEGTSHLLSKLLEYRKVDVQNTQTEALRRLTAESNMQNETLRALIAESGKDSRSVKIVTFIATIYLPASLMASIFSAGLIHLPQPTDPNKLSVQGATWIYVLTSAILATITVTGAYYWDRHLK